jgi:hypothetical protein
MLEECDGMQAHVEVLSWQTPTLQAMLSAQFFPEQADVPGDLARRKDRQEQVVTQQSA